MTPTDPTHAHTLEADPADTLMAAWTDAMEALTALAECAADVQCPGCDPDGARTETVRVALAERYSLVTGDADLMLARAADARGVLLGVLIPPCGHDEDGEADRDGPALT